MTAVVGASVALTFEFARPDGTLYDPDIGTGKITLRAPSDPLDGGIVYTVGASGDPIEKVATGRYTLTVMETEAGRWRWRADSDETVDGETRHDVGEGSFSIAWSRVVTYPASS